MQVAQCIFLHMDTWYMKTAVLHFIHFTAKHFITVQIECTVFSVHYSILQLQGRWKGYNYCISVGMFQWKEHNTSSYARIPGTRRLQRYIGKPHSKKLLQHGFACTVYLVHYVCSIYSVDTKSFCLVCDTFRYLHCHNQSYTCIKRYVGQQSNSHP